MPFFQGLEKKIYYYFDLHLMKFEVFFMKVVAKIISGHKYNFWRLLMRPINIDILLLEMYKCTSFLFFFLKKKILTIVF